MCLCICPYLLQYHCRYFFRRIFFLLYGNLVLGSHFPLDIHYCIIGIQYSLPFGGISDNSIAILRECNNGWKHLTTERRTFCGRYNHRSTSLKICCLRIGCTQIYSYYYFFYHFTHLLLLFSHLLLQNLLIQPP